MKQKSDVELLSEAIYEYPHKSIFKSYKPPTKEDLEKCISKIIEGGKKPLHKLDEMDVMSNAALTAMSAVRQQLQAEVDELKQGIEHKNKLGRWWIERCRTYKQANAALEESNSVLQQRCEELEKYARHKDGCEERSYYQSSCKKCGYLLKDHDGKFCVVLNDGKISYHKAEQFDPNLKCTCGLDQLLTPNERK